MQPGDIINEAGAFDSPWNEESAHISRGPEAAGTSYQVEVSVKIDSPYNNTRFINSLNQSQHITTFNKFQKIDFKKINKVFIAISF